MFGEGSGCGERGDSFSDVNSLPGGRWSGLLAGGGVGVGGGGEMSSFWEK